MSAPARVAPLTSREAARLAGVSVSTLRSWYRSGRLKCASKTASGRYRWWEAEVRRAAGLTPAAASIGSVAGMRKQPKRDGWKVTVRAPRPSGKDGRNYVLRYYPPDAKRYERSAKTPDREAAEALARSEEARLNGRASLADVIRQHVKWRREVGEGKPTTLQRYLDAAKRFEGVGDLSKATLVQAQDQLRAELAAVTVNNYFSYAKRAWDWAEQRGLVSKPWPGIKRIKAKRTKLRPCTPLETSLILEQAAGYAKGRHYPLLCLLADLGSRVTETLCLRERDLDRDACTVRLLETKTGDPRVVCVSPDVVALIPHREDPDAWLFESPSSPGQRMDRMTVYFAFRKCAERAGLKEEPISPHSLRRGWIADALAAGVPLAQSMRHTGHASARVHLDYQRLAPGRGMAAAAEQVRKQRPALPHQAPTPEWVGGANLAQESPNKEGNSAVSRSGCTASRSGSSVENGRKSPDTSDSGLETPTEIHRLRALLRALTAVGGGEVLQTLEELVEDQPDLAQALQTALSLEEPS